MYRLLIVDDEERIVNSLYSFLSEAFDFEIHRALSGMEAEALLRKMRFDIVLSDIAMPKMSGLELLSVAKRLWPKCHFILLTAYNNFDYAYHAMKYERVDYLLKIESYEEIKRRIQAKLDQLEEDRREQERLLHMDQDLQAMSRGLRGYFLKRIIVQGIQLPEQKDLDAVQVPIRLDRPALLALGLMGEGNLLGMNRAMGAAEAYLRRRLSEYGMSVISHVSAGYVLWVIQDEGSAFTDQERALLAQEAFSQLVQLEEDRSEGGLSLLCAESFVPWAAIHRVYQRAVVQMEHMRDQGGLALLPVAERQAPQPPAASFPNLDEVNMLWDLFKRGDREGFVRAMSEGLEGMAAVGRFSQTMPNPSVFAVTFLFSEAMALYGAAQTEETRRLTACEGYESGAAWLEDVLRLSQWLFDQRENSRKDMDQWLLRQIDAYLRAHFAEDVTLTSLAEELHYNPSYLSRFYKKHTGKNLMSFLTELRMAHAKELLAHTNLKVGEVARQCGFYSPKYFNQIFRKTTGQTAAYYRQPAEPSQQNRT